MDVGGWVVGDGLGPGSGLPRISITVSDTYPLELLFCYRGNRGCAPRPFFPKSRVLPDHDKYYTSMPCVCLSCLTRSLLL